MKQIHSNKTSAGLRSTAINNWSNLSEAYKSLSPMAIADRVEAEESPWALNTILCLSLTVLHNPSYARRMDEVLICWVEVDRAHRI